MANRNMEREGRFLSGISVAVCRLFWWCPEGLFEPPKGRERQSGIRVCERLRLPGWTDPYPYRGPYRGKSPTQK